MEYKMEQLEYLVADPAGNITILVLSETDRRDYSRVAKALLDHCPEAEQVGFVKSGQPLPTMEMSGLEFCGNASRAFAYYEATKAGKSGGAAEGSDATEDGDAAEGGDATEGSDATEDGDAKADSRRSDFAAGHSDIEADLGRMELTVCVSGCSEPLRAWAHVNAGISGIEMPLPQASETIEIPLSPEDAAILPDASETIELPLSPEDAVLLPGEDRLPKDADPTSATPQPRRLRGTLVHLEGISHLVIPVMPETSGREDDKAGNQESLGRLFDRIREYVYRECERDMPAFGVMFLDKETCEMIPIVYVREVETVYFEGSCASGSAAAGYALASEQAAEELSATTTMTNSNITNHGMTNERATKENPAIRRFLLRQPAGELEVIAEADSAGVRRLLLQGSISLSGIKTFSL